MTQHLTTDELADRWKTKVLWITEQARTGKIPGAWKLGNQWRFDVTDIELYEQTRKRSNIFELTPGARKRSKNKSA